MGFTARPRCKARRICLNGQGVRVGSMHPGALQAAEKSRARLLMRDAVARGAAARTIWPATAYQGNSGVKSAS